MPLVPDADEGPAPETPAGAADRRRAGLSSSSCPASAPSRISSSISAAIPCSPRISLPCCATSRRSTSPSATSMPTRPCASSPPMSKRCGPPKPAERHHRASQDPRRLRRTGSAAVPSWRTMIAFQVAFMLGLIPVFALPMLITVPPVMDMLYFRQGDTPDDPVPDRRRPRTVAADAGHRARQQVAASSAAISRASIRSGAATICAGGSSRVCRRVSGLGAFGGTPLAPAHVAHHGCQGRPQLHAADRPRRRLGLHLDRRRHQHRRRYADSLRQGRERLAHHRPRRHRQPLLHRRPFRLGARRQDGRRLPSRRPVLPAGRRSDPVRRIRPRLTRAQGGRCRVRPARARRAACRARISRCSASPRC